MQVENRIRTLEFDDGVVVLDIGISFTKVGYMGSSYLDKCFQHLTN